jgi:hypothetical protein
MDYWHSKVYLCLSLYSELMLHFPHLSKDWLIYDCYECNVKKEHLNASNIKASDKYEKIVGKCTGISYWDSTVEKNYFNEWINVVSSFLKQPNIQASIPIISNNEEFLKFTDIFDSITINRCYNSDSKNCKLIGSGIPPTRTDKCLYCYGCCHHDSTVIDNTVLENKNEFKACSIHFRKNENDKLKYIFVDDIDKFVIFLTTNKSVRTDVENFMDDSKMLIKSCICTE